MFATPHMLAGAAVGKIGPRAWIALPAAFVLHFLLDYAPHIDAHRLFGGRHGVTPMEATAAAIDMLVGVALVLWASARQPARRLILWAAFAGIVIDIVDNVPPWNAWFRAWPPTAHLSAFHHHFQHNVGLAQWPLGFGTQLAVILLALWIVRRRA